MATNFSCQHRIFLYGTLKRGQPNYFHMENRKHGVTQFVSTALTETAYPLVISTTWNLPFLLYAPGKGQQIHGEIYDIDDAFLEWLDEFEGHPDMYIREKITVSLVSNGTSSLKTCENLGKTECWTYFLKKFPSEMLDLENLSSYDSSGDHNRVYKPEEDQLSRDNVEEALRN